MKHLGIAVIASMLGTMSASAADRMWTGKISDSMCVAKHNTPPSEPVTMVKDRFRMTLILLSC